MRKIVISTGVKKSAKVWNKELTAKKVISFVV